MTIGTFMIRMLKEVSRVNHSRLLINQSGESSLKLSARSFCVNPETAESEEPNPVENSVAKEFDPKDRSVKIPVATSIRYIKSRAYSTAYGTEPVWVQYRRNFRGQFQPRFTRKSCIINDKLASGNPCPICRDEYLVLHETNVDLLKQFISPHNGEVLHWSKTGVCQRQFDLLMVCILRAQDLGLLTHHVPFRQYDYSLYSHE